MTAAANRLRRLLHLLPEVADGQAHGLDELAARAGVDAKVVARDLRELAERYDDPGGFVEGVRVHIEASAVSVMTDHFHRPMRLVEPELRALELGLGVLARERPAEERPALDRARTRLREAMAQLPDTDLDVAWLACGGGSGVDQETLSTLRRAVRARKVVRIEYQKAHESEAAWREVSPVGLVFSGGAWYLVAAGTAGTAEDGYRFFRCDRILAAEGTERSAELPEGCSLDTVMEQGRPFSFPPAEPLVVRFAPKAARWIAEREGRELEADGSLTVEYPLGDEEWAVRFVLQYGGAAEVLGPAGVRKRVARVVDRLTGARTR